MLLLIWLFLERLLQWMQVCPEQDPKEIQADGPINGGCSVNMAFSIISFRMFVCVYVFMCVFVCVCVL